MGKGYESVEEWTSRTVAELQAELERRASSLPVAPVAAPTVATAPAVRRQTLIGLWRMVCDAVRRWYKLGDGIDRRQT